MLLTVFFQRRLMVGHLCAVELKFALVGSSELQGIQLVQPSDVWTLRLA